jgi:glycosyltransferase involved in cell wall biosynthesis
VKHKTVVFLTGEYPPMQGGIADHTAYLAQYLTPLGVESSILISRRWQNAQTSKVLKTFEVSHPIFASKRNVATRIVTTFHDLRVPYIFPKAGSFRWKSTLALARYSDAVICTNREDLNQLSMINGQWSIVNDKWSMVNNQSQRDASQLPISPAPLPSRSSAPLLTLIPLGSNVEPQPPADFERSAWRSRYEAAENTLLLAYFGFLNESKGGEALVEALALLRQQGLDARLLLIGGDIGHADPTNVAYAQRVQALIDHRHLADFVYRTGYTDLPQISANLLAADVVVMPYRDGVSFRRTTLIAALRHGCPVVSTHPADPGAIPEIQPGENMLLVPPSDAAALAETIMLLADNSSLREKLSQGAVHLGHLFEWETIARDTAGLYHTILDT